MGQLTNLYVSQSYQGLLKMTDSTSGLTNTLQTIQAGDGTNSPLQMSTTQVNISGSLTVNGSPIEFTNTGSFATTGSNTFIGAQIIQGNVTFPSNSFVSTDNVSGALYFSALNQGTLYINGDGGEGDVIVGYPAWQNNLTVYGETELTGSLGVSSIKGTGSLFLQPNNADARYLEIYNTSPTDTHITGSGGQIFIGDDVTYVKVDNYGSVKRIDIVADNLVNVSGSMSVTGSIDITGQYLINGVPFSGGTNGTSGTSGSSGSDGSSGTSGSSGSDGSSGTSGSSGSDGSSGTSGSSGSDGSSGTSGSSGISNSFFNYQAKTTITSGNPGSGHVIWNNATQTGATSINVSDIDQNGDNLDVFLSQLKNGSRITFQDKAIQGNIQVWDIGTSTDNTTYWTYPVTLVSATHQFSNNDDILFIITTTPSGTSGTSGTNGSSGSSGTSGSDGSSGTSGSSGSSGTQGTSGSSGTSGADGLGLPSKVISTVASNFTYVDYSGINPGLSGSTQVVTFAQPFASGDYSIDLLWEFTNNNYYDAYWSNASRNDDVTFSGKTSSGFTAIIWNIDLTANPYSGMTGYYNCIAAGASNGSGSSGTSGAAGSSGTSGTSAAGDRDGLITTGSVALQQSITGSLNISEGLINTGSLTNVGDVYIFNNSFSSASVKLNVTSSAFVSQSNMIFGNPVGAGAGNATGSIVISGSNNILFNGTRQNTLVSQGSYGYIGTNSNIVVTIPTLNTGSLVRPTMSNNNLNGALALTFITSSLANPIYSNNINLASISINHPSGSVSAQNNIMNAASLGSTANVTRLDLNTAIQTNTLFGNSVTLNHVSSSIQFNQNAGGGVTVNNFLSSSVSVAANNITVQRNIFNGNGNTITVSGSNSANRRTITDNLILGVSNRVNSDYSTSTTGHLVATALLGDNLIVSASNTSNTAGGTVIVGRFNATGSLQESSQDTVFVVGTGLNANDRRNALRIDSNNNSNFTGSVRISGSLYVTDKINDLKIWTGSALVNSIGIGNNTLAASAGVPLSNIAIGNNALSTNVTGSNVVAIGNQALQNSVAGFNLAVGATALSANTTGRYNVAIGQSSYQANTIGEGNTAIGWNSGVNNVTGSTNTIIGAQALQQNFSGSGNVAIGFYAGYYSTGSNQFFIGNDNYGSLSSEQNKSMMYGEFNGTTANQTLQINAQTRITGSLAITGSLTLNGSAVGSTVGLISTGSIGTAQAITGSLTMTGSVYVTGSVQGNVNSLSISSNTASLNLANGNFYTLQLVSGSNTFINPSNISQGQTVNILLSTTGSATVSFPTSVKQAVGFTYVPTTTTSKDIITLVSFDNSSLYLANVKNLA